MDDQRSELLEYRFREPQPGCPPHAWGSPVIMKRDPDHVAWTCGRCGEIALTDDLAVRPGIAPTKD